MVLKVRPDCPRRSKPARAIPKNEYRAARSRPTFVSINDVFSMPRWAKMTHLRFQP